MELLHPLSWFSGMISGNRGVWFYWGNLAEREASQPFWSPTVCGPQRSTNIAGCFHRHYLLLPKPTPSPRSTISLFLRELSSLPCGLLFPLHTIDGFILYDCAEAFDISGHLLFPRMFFPLGFCAVKLSPCPLNPPSQPPSLDLVLFLHLTPLCLWFPGFHAQLTSLSSWVSRLIPTLASVGNSLMNPKSRPFLNSRYIHPFA